MKLFTQRFGAMSRSIRSVAILNLFVLTGMLAPLSALAQVNLSATAGTANGSYATLGAAFGAINAGTHRGAITINLTGNTTESASAVLSASGAGAANYTGVTVSPSGGTPRIVSGNIAGALIDLDGADNVSINGLNTSGNALTLTNLNTGASTSTLRLINDASNNTISNVSILGSGTSATQGTVVLGTGTTTGNDNNFISNCNIAEAGVNTPVNGVFASGSASPVENSGNTIENCNVANFFSPSLATTGILIGPGNTQWTLSGNRLFQSATRTYTTANTHRGIQVASGSDHVVSGNRLGFASGAGTGFYTMDGAVASRFVAIDINVPPNAPVSVQGNTILSISLATTSNASTTFGALCGINVSGGDVSVGNITPNAIGRSTGVDSLIVTSTANGALVAGIHSSSQGVVTIQNNTIGGLTSSGITATIAGSVTAINTSGTPGPLTITGNTIGNSTANNLRGGTSGLTTGNSLVSGIHLNFTSGGSHAVTNNTIQNLASFGTGTTGFVRGIWTNFSTSAANTLNISNSTIRNLTTDTANAGIANGLAGAVGIVLGMSTGSTVSDNLISNISRTNTAAIGGWTAGITHGNASNTTITRNRIFALSNASTSVSLTAPGIAAGIVIRSGGTMVTASNNMISLGDSETTNTAFIGIQANHGSTPDPVDQIFYNTINISGTAAAGAIPSFGFLRGDLTIALRNQTVDLRNNLITNTRSGGTGAHFAIANNFGSTASATGWTTNASNFNVLNANAATVGHWNGNQTFAGWRTASLSDANSYSGIAVNYVNPANDLHLNMGLAATVIESGGTPILGTIIDIDQQTRPGPAGSVNGGAFAPDIGADEFDGVLLDINGPTISYPTLSNTTSVGDRVLAVSISDFTGVPTTGALVARIYYRKNAGAYVSQPCVLASGTSTNGNWNCTILNSSLGGVSTGDAVQYFVVAQDTLGNISANPNAGFVGANVNTVTTPPTTPNQYLISIAYSGIYNVGTAEALTSLTNAGGVFEAINNGILTGNVTFNITSDLLLETGTVALNQWLENGVGGYTLLIKPSGAPRLVSGSFNGALIRLNGADRVTIDGSTTGATASGQVGGDPALRELTIQNTSTGTSSVIINVGSGSNGAQNNTLRNLNVHGQDPTTTFLGIGIGSSNFPGNVGIDNDNNRVENCAIRRAIYGLYSGGQSLANPNTGTVFTMNDLTGTGTDRIRHLGISVFSDDGAQVSLNSVGGIESNLTQDAIGISMGVLLINGSPAAINGVTNALVSRNRIQGVSNTNTFSTAGIAVVGAPGGANTIANNMISGVIANSTGGDIVAGIFVQHEPGSSARVLYNSVELSGDRGSLSTMPSFGIAITGANPTIELKNNSISTTQFATGASTAAKSYAIGMQSTAFTNLDSNFNNFFASGANAGFFRSGSLGAGTGTDYATVAAWGAAVSDDADSLQLDPLYVSTSDLHLQATSPLIGEATPLASVTNDFDNHLRSTTTPCIGADEIIDADLQIGKDNSAVGLLNGQSTVYAIVVANAGPLGVNNASLTDNLPSTLINGSWACIQAQSTATCPIPNAGLGNLTSSVNIAAGQHLRFDVMGTVNGSVGGFVTNTVNVTAPNGINDTNTLNNSATDQDPILTIGIFADGFENSTRNNLTVPGANEEMGH